MVNSLGNLLETSGAFTSNLGGVHGFCHHIVGVFQSVFRWFFRIKSCEFCNFPLKQPFLGFRLLGWETKRSKKTWGTPWEDASPVPKPCPVELVQSPLQYRFLVIQLILSRVPRSTNRPFRWFRWSQVPSPILGALWRRVDSTGMSPKKSWSSSSGCRNSGTSGAKVTHGMLRKIGWLA